MDVRETLRLLQRTRPITVAATVFLAVQLFGNLYEQLVTNVEAIANPTVQSIVGELEPGSPLYYYLPWAPLGVVLVVVLAVRLRRSAPGWIARRVWASAGALLVAVAAKAYLISSVNPLFRDPTADVDALRGYAIGWAVGNAVAIAAVAVALVLLLGWRRTVVDDLVDTDTADREVSERAALHTSSRIVTHQ